MFCPKCGKADQSPETYCRQCGLFLPDLVRQGKAPISPEQHVTANIVLSAMTIVACLTLAGLLYSVLAFRPDTHWLIYAAGGFLLAMGAWQIQTLWRTILLRKHFKKNKPQTTSDIAGGSSGKLLEKLDFENLVPSSVTDTTTRHLAEAQFKSPQT